MKTLKFTVLVLLTFNISGVLAAIEACSCGFTAPKYNQCCAEQDQPIPSNRHHSLHDMPDIQCKSKPKSNAGENELTKESCICAKLDTHLCNAPLNEVQRHLNVPGAASKYSIYLGSEITFISTDSEFPIWSISFSYPSSVSRIYLRISSLLL